MSDELAKLREKVAQYEQRDRAHAVDGALSSAIAAAGVTLRPGCEQQVAALLRPDVIEAQAGGQTVLAGPGLVSLNEHVRSKLQSQAFEHFRADGAPVGARTQATGAYSREGQLSNAIGAMSGARREMVPVDQTMGAAVIAHMAAARQAAGDPRTNLSLPMGLKATN